MLESEAGALKVQSAVSLEYASVKIVAAITGLSESHIRRSVYSGELPALNAGTKAHPLWRIARKDLAEWMERKKGGSLKVPPKSELKELVNRYFPD